jgi:hypothetical protein
MKKIFLYKRLENRVIVKTNVYVMVDDEDYESVSKNRWYIMRLYHCDTEILYARRYAGAPRNGDFRAVLMHREILGAVGREQKVDHKDGNGLNNQKSNIRICTHSENMSNRKAAHNKEVKYLGVWVCRKTGKYMASMKLNGKVYSSRQCETPELAALAYNELILKHKPEFGKLNEIKCQ